MNRGAGLCLLKTDEVREEAAMTFLRWLLEPDRNVNFVTKAGYMPVTEKGFSDYLPDAVGTLESPRYKSLYKTFMEMQQEYSFYTPPQVSFYLDKETLFEKNVRQLLAEDADIYISEVDKASSTDASADDKILDTLSSDAMEKLKDIVE
jgi:multiple sugar transport system substrate-binding protein